MPKPGHVIWDKQMNLNFVIDGVQVNHDKNSIRVDLLPSNPRKDFPAVSLPFSSFVNRVKTGVFVKLKEAST